MPIAEPPYPRMHDDGRALLLRPGHYRHLGHFVDDETRLRTASPHEPGAWRQLGEWVAVDRARSVRENVARLTAPDRAVGARVVDAFDVARHGLLRVLGR